MADKPLIILHGEMRTPPLSKKARIVAGALLRQLQRGIMLEMPESRPMPRIGKRCYELRIQDAETNRTWRIIYRIDLNAILVADVFAKKTQTTPLAVIEVCRKRFQRYDLVISNYE